MSSSCIHLTLLCGGASPEHDVSVSSAREVWHALAKERYIVEVVFIDRSGMWWLIRDASCWFASETHETREACPRERVVFLPGGGGEVYSLDQGRICMKADVVFPLLHGPFGEDGTVQGALLLAGVPFVGSGVCASAAGMDKDVTKRLLREAGIPVGSYIAFRSPEAVPNIAHVKEVLGLPCFIKPASMGSSIGVTKVSTEAEYQAAVACAFSCDQKILIEAMVVGREIECAVLGNRSPQVSLPGEVVVHRGFYSYEAKYQDPNASSLVIPAVLTPEEVARAQEVALHVYKTLGCEGLARVDLFLTPEGEVFVNEVNTMPGFTTRSMYPKLWEASGKGYGELLDDLVCLALEKYQERAKTGESF